MSDDRPYRVGRGKPPPEYRFQKGVSGNPTGRPKGSKNRVPTGIGISNRDLDDIFRAEAYRKYNVTEGSKVRRMAAIHAAVRSLMMLAAKGNRLAAKDMIRMIQGIEEREHEESLDAMSNAIAYKENARLMFARAKLRGLPEPDLLPHPDDVIIDPLNMEVRVEGPLTREGKQAIEHIMAFRDGRQTAVSFFAHQFATDNDAERRELALTAWHRAQEFYDRLNDPLPARCRKSMVDRSYAEGASREGQFEGEYQPPHWLIKLEDDRY